MAARCQFLYLPFFASLACGKDIPIDIGGITRVHDDASKGLGLSLAFAALMLCIFMVYWLLRSKFKAVPEAIASILFGVVVGLISRFLGANVTQAIRDSLPSADSFFLLVLPPIIFQAGYSLHKGNFIRQIGSICMFAIPGTVIMALSFGFLIWLAGVIGLSYPLSIVDSLAFGSLLSAVDPVATLAIFNSLNVPEVLYTLVMGESVLNDAVSISLYRMFVSLEADDDHDTVSIAAVLLDFTWSFFGSIIIGILVAFGSACIFRFTNMRQYPALEFAAVCILAYWPFAFCEGIGMSGILAILSNAAFMAHYTRPNLSILSQITTEQTFKVMSLLAEHFVFVFLGLVLTTERLEFHPSLVFCSILLSIAVRALNVFPMSWLLNHYRTDKICLNHQVVMFYSGLRGAIAFALAMNLPIRPEARAVIQTTALFIVLFTVLVLGGSTMPLLRWLRVTEHPPVAVASAPSTATSTTAIQWSALAPDAASDLHTWYDSSSGYLEQLDQRFVAPYLIRPQSTALDNESVAALFKFLPRTVARQLWAVRDDWLPLQPDPDRDPHHPLPADASRMPRAITPLPAVATNPDHPHRVVVHREWEGGCRSGSQSGSRSVSATGLITPCSTSTNSVCNSPATPSTRNVPPAPSTPLQLSPPAPHASTAPHRPLSH